jgi:LysM repeat protein
MYRAETLTFIAKKYGTKVETIAALNNITNVDMVQTGQELVIPVPSQGFTKVRTSFIWHLPYVFSYMYVNHFMLPNQTISFWF